MQIPSIDLQKQYKSIKKQIDNAVGGDIRSGSFILGPEVAALEEKVASFCGVKYAVAVASGTDALHLALLACEVGPGDEVITTPFTFIATTETIISCGARPVFADIDLQTYNIDPDQIASKITARTRAILPVHLFGQTTGMNPIKKLARQHKLKVIEDCAQAMNSFYKGKHAGSLGDAGTLSFFPTKTLGGYGDGGMVITNSKKTAEKIRQLRNHGAAKKYYYKINGFNSRLDSIQAAVLRVKLRYLPKWTARRRLIASWYDQYLSASGVVTPKTAPGNHHSYNYYTIAISGNRRNQLRKYLRQQGIATEVYYPLCLHLQEVYKKLAYGKGAFPVAEKCQNEVLSLPMYPELGEKQVAAIARSIARYCR